jgi:hypothetical protein
VPYPSGHEVCSVPLCGGLMQSHYHRCVYINIYSRLFSFCTALVAMLNSDGLSGSPYKTPFVCGISMDMQVP